MREILHLCDIKPCWNLECNIPMKYISLVYSEKCTTLKLYQMKSSTIRSDGDCLIFAMIPIAKMLTSKEDLIPDFCKTTILKDLYIAIVFYISHWVWITKKRNIILTITRWNYCIGFGICWLREVGCLSEELRVKKRKSEKGEKKTHREELNLI